MEDTLYIAEPLPTEASQATGRRTGTEGLTNNSMGKPDIPVIPWSLSEFRLQPRGQLIPRGLTTLSHLVLRWLPSESTHLSPTLYLATSHWYLEISHGGSIYTMTFNKFYQSELYQEPVDKSFIGTSLFNQMLLPPELQPPCPSWFFLVHIKCLRALHGLLCLPGVLFAQISHGSVLDLRLVFVQVSPFQWDPPWPLRLKLQHFWCLLPT